QWRGWERGITHIDMVHPRIQTLNGTQLAWSPATPKKGVTAELVVLPTVSDSAAFARWVPSVKGKMVMVSMKQLTGRPEYSREEFATEETFAKRKAQREAQTKAWDDNMRKPGYYSRTPHTALEGAGAAGIVPSHWCRGFGANK